MIIILLILFLIIYYKYINLPINNIKKLTKILSINRPVESANLKKVKNIVMNEMNNINLYTYEQKFTKTINNKSYNFSNIIGINKLNTKPYILLVAHIDSYSFISGEFTTDSITSITIILELAKNLLKINPSYPIMILFVDGEETIDGTWTDKTAILGSSYFVNNFDLTKISKVCVLDLIGYSFNHKIALFNDNLKSYDDLHKMYKLNLKYNYQIFDNPNSYISNKIIFDDHVPFKNKKKDYILLSPYKFSKIHHTIHDNYKNVNWKYVEIFYNILFDYLNN